MASPKVITVDPRAGDEWLRTHYPKRKRMNPKIRDQIAIAVGVAAVYALVNHKKDAKLAILTALGAATALWVVHRYDNAEG